MSRADAVVERVAQPLPERRVGRGRRTLRVGYVLDRFPRTSHRFVLQEILELQALGVVVDVFSLDAPEGRRDDIAAALARVEGAVCYFPGESAEGAAPWVAKEAAARRTEHLHAHSGLTPTVVAREAARLAGIGYSFTAYPDSVTESADVPSIRANIDESQFVVTMSDVYRGRLLRMCEPGIAPTLHSIPIGIDTAACRFREPGAQDDDSVLAVGPLTVESGYLQLVDAVTLLRDCGRRVCLTLVGEGPCDPVLRDQIERARLGSRVHVLTQVSVPDLMTLLRFHTALVLPQVSGDHSGEMLASLVLEAAASGVVVLSTEPSPVRELIDEDLTGRLINPRDPVWLAGTLSTLFDCPDLRQRLAWTARTRVERRFTAAHNVVRLARLFVDAVAAKRLRT